MPYINRVRLVNVRFNNNNSRYEDLKMPFDGKSTTYELVNGGGKSVLLMMILQAVLPNESLKPEQPVKNIFLNTKDISSHLLVEWILEDGGYYTHLLTGFCAKKARDKEGANGYADGGVDYFNYTYLYNGNNHDDIYNLELLKEEAGYKKVTSYGDLKNKLHKLKDSGKAVEIFEHRKKEYQEFLKQYQIIQAEWDILKKINIRENNLANFFREDKSSRKLIENFLVGIVDKVAENKDNLSEEEFANILIKMKVQFEELQRQYALLDEYEKYQVSLNRLIEVTNKALEVFENVDNFNKEIASIVHALSELFGENKELLNKKKDELKIEKEHLNDVIKNLKNIEVRRLQLLVEQKSFEDKLKEDEVRTCKEKIASNETDRLYYQAVNKYFDYKEYESKIAGKREDLKKIEMSDVELVENRNHYGVQLKSALTIHKEDFDKKKVEIDSEKAEMEKNIKQCDDEINKFSIEQGTYQSDIKRFEEESKNDKKALEICNKKLLQTGEINCLIYDADILITQKKAELINATNKFESTESEIISFSERIKDGLLEKKGLEGKKDVLISKQEDNVKQINTYKKSKEQIDGLVTTYGIHDIDVLRTELQRISDEENLRKSEVEFLIKDIDKQIDIIKKYGIYVFNQELIEIYNHLSNRLNHVILGSQYLKDLLPKERKELLNKHKLLPYSIMLFQAEFNKVKNDASIIGKKFVDTMIPIINYDTIKRDGTLDSDAIIFPTRDIDFHLGSLENVEDFEKELLEKRRVKKNESNELTNSLKSYQSYIEKINRFLEDYPEYIISEMMDTEVNHKELIKGIGSKLKELSKELSECEGKLVALTHSLEGMRSYHKNMQVVIELLEKYKQLSDSINISETELEKNKRLLVINNNLLDKKKSDKNSINSKLESLRAEIESIKGSLKECKEELNTLIEFNVPEGIVLNIDTIEAIREKYFSYNKRYKEESQNISRIQEEIIDLTTQKDKVIDELEDLEFTVEMVENNKPINRVSKEIITEKKKIISALNTELDALVILKGGIHDEFIRAEDSYSKQCSSYEESYGDYIALDGAKDIDSIKAMRKDFRGLKETYSELCCDIEEEISDIQSKVYKYEREHRDFEQFAEFHKIDLSDYEDFNYDDVLFDDYKNRYNLLDKAVKKNQSSFESEKNKLLRESENYTVRNFRDDIEQMDTFDSLYEVENMTNKLCNYLEMLQKRIEKILVEIDHEKKMKDTFIQQCVNAGVWMYEQLMKLNSLSKIKIPEKDAKINMVEIDLKLFDEEVQKSRMENHIKSLSERINDENKDILSKELSSKAFLAQVADMNNPKVYLYKVEDIIKNSRKIRWENAVESDGQTHTLYFLFLASIISFIRKLSTNTEDVTKKVLLVDNPFGSASAVYLWRVMFEMLEQNNFQLISAGHNISKEILPFFEVNYLLGQDIMSDGTKKVVVHDFRGIVENEKLASEHLEVEQISLF